MSSQPVLVAWRRDMIFTDAAFEYARTGCSSPLAQTSTQLGTILTSNIAVMHNLTTSDNSSDAHLTFMASFLRRWPRQDTGTAFTPELFREDLAKQLKYSQMKSRAMACKKESSSVEKFMFDIREKPKFISRVREQAGSLQTLCTAWGREVQLELLGKPDRIMEQVVISMEGIVIEYEKAISKAETRTEEVSNDLGLACLLLKMKLKFMAAVLEGVAAEKMTFSDVMLILPKIVRLDDQCIVGLWQLTKLATLRRSAGTDHLE